jgi:protein tyrosine phosphatase type 4A
MTAPAAPNGRSTPVFARANAGTPNALHHFHSSSAPRLISPPTCIEYRGLRFLISDAPSDSNLALYEKEFEKHGVTDVVRVCEPTYAKERLEAHGFHVHDLPFPDGKPPPDAVIDIWLHVIDEVFSPTLNGKMSNSGPSSPTSSQNDARSDTSLPLDDKPHVDHAATAPTSSSPHAVAKPPCIAIHCVAGLGRAPVLVCIALVERGLGKLESVEFVRERRRGAINNRQLAYVEGYRRRPKKPCTIM